ncbi:hypothetical protein GDO86_017360 [Hymenochirus boettgeri]|uniref:Secreted protein n=1 Tax=Hymenochirus boettgeri TaxID=247094 RepID=A0A8T2IPT5_9PIPI|nr:hypothetical protein GDO86_017360 [Hymenochirus boettgeri]
MFSPFYSLLLLFCAQICLCGKLQRPCCSCYLMKVYSVTCCPVTLGLLYKEGSRGVAICLLKIPWLFLLCCNLFKDNVKSGFLQALFMVK